MLLKKIPLDFPVLYNREAGYIIVGLKPILLLWSLRSRRQYLKKQQMAYFTRLVFTQ